MKCKLKQILLIMMILMKSTISIKILDNQIVAKKLLQYIKILNKVYSILSNRIKISNKITKKINNKKFKMNNYKMHNHKVLLISWEKLKKKNQRLKFMKIFKKVKNINKILIINL